MQFRDHFYFFNPNLCLETDVDGKLLQMLIFFEKLITVINLCLISIYEQLLKAIIKITVINNNVMILMYGRTKIKKLCVNKFL